MARGRTAIFGRDAELAELDAALRAQPAQSKLIVLRGPAGIGRSALLDTLARGWAQPDIQVLAVRYTAQTDTLGAGAVLAAVRDYYERVNDPRLADSIAAISRLLTPPASGAPSTPAALLIELVSMFSLIRGGRRTVLLVDDVQAVARPALLLAAARRSGVLVVAACRHEEFAAPGIDQVLTIADQVLELAPLGDEAVAALLDSAGGGVVDEAVLPALRTALGPLAGSPGTVLSTMEELRARGRLVAVRDQLCLREPHEPIALPATHRHVRCYDELDGPGRVLLALLSAGPGLGVDDLPAFAAVTGVDVAEYGRTVDRLVGLGVLIADKRGGLRLCAPALAAAIRERIAEREPAELAATFAKHLLSGRSHVEHSALLADLVAIAGAALPPDPCAAAALRAHAEHVARTQPDRATYWYRAALRHAVDPAPVIAALLPLLIRVGDYRQLADVVAELLADARPIMAGLATAAALAALHTGRPLPDAPWPAGHPGIALAHRWFAGTAFTTPAAGPAASGPDPDATSESLTDPLDPAGFDQLAAQLTDNQGGLIGDVVAAGQRVFGPGYGPPVDGPLAAYHRVQTGYATGDWPGALSAARELELVDVAAGPVHQLGRLLAAEMCAARGEARRAAAWLATVDEDGPFEAVLGWVRVGMLTVAGDAEGAALTGWQYWERARAAGRRLGVDRLLVRTADAALRGDRTELAERLLVAAEARHAELDSVTTAEGHLLLRGLVLGDRTAARAGAELVRRREHLPDLVTAYVIVGRLDDQPRTWLHEAYRLAGQFGSPWLRAHLKDLMRERGITAPRNRSARQPFSDTELRIIELIRDGRTNRQIAADVRISEKTVENHLTRLFARTGYRSRLELAAASLEGRLLASSNTVEGR